MKLPKPAETYSPTKEAVRNREIERADRMNHKRDQDVEIGNGRLILTDTATGTRYDVTIASGTLTLTSI